MWNDLKPPTVSSLDHVLQRHLGRPAQFRWCGQPARQRIGVGDVLTGALVALLPAMLMAEISLAMLESARMVHRAAVVLGSLDGTMDGFVAWVLWLCWLIVLMAALWGWGELYRRHTVYALTRDLMVIYHGFPRRNLVAARLCRIVQVALEPGHADRGTVRFSGPHGPAFVNIRHARTVFDLAIRGGRRRPLVEAACKPDVGRDAA